MSDKSPAFQLYVAKAVAGTAFLTSDAFKAYWLTLWWMWLESRDHCSMRDTDTAWKKATLGIFPDSVLKIIRAEIMDQDAPLLQEENGFLISNGLRKEAVKQSEWRAKSRLGGLKSADIRRTDSNHPSTTHPTKEEPHSNTLSLSLSSSLSLSTPKKHHVEIINYLNEVLGTNYKAGSKATMGHINARMDEGYEVEDFKRAIDRQYKEWAGTENAKYLRPATLFNSDKFEGYVNVAQGSAGDKSLTGISDEEFEKIKKEGGWE